jgi:hypothetical protein
MEFQLHLPIRSTSKPRPSSDAADNGRITGDAELGRDNEPEGPVDPPLLRQRMAKRVSRAYGPPNRNM